MRHAGPTCIPAPGAGSRMATSNTTTAAVDGLKQVAENSEHETTKKSATTTATDCSMFRHICKMRHVDEQQLAQRERVWACGWHHSGRLLASAGEDRTVKVWRLAAQDEGKNGSNKEEEAGHSNGEIPAEKQQPASTAELELACCLRGDQSRAIRWVCFSPCGRFLATASFDASVLIYEQQRHSGEFEERHRLEGHESEVKCCAFSASGQWLATCSRDKTVWVWKVDDEDGTAEEGDGGGDYEVLSILQQHTADVKFVVWHPREDLLVSGGYDCSLRFYTFDGEDWTTAQEIPDAHSDTIWAAAFEPTAGRHLATVAGDRTIRVWTRTQKEEEEGKPGNWRDWHKTTEFALFEQTKWPLYTVAWSSRSNYNGGILAVGGGDRIVRFFTFDEENEALALLGSIRLDSEINCLSWRPMSSTGQQQNTAQQQLAVAVDDGHVHLLQIEEGQTE